MKSLAKQPVLQAKRVGEEPPRQEADTNVQPDRPHLTIGEKITWYLVIFGLPPLLIYDIWGFIYYSTR